MNISLENIKNAGIIGAGGAGFPTFYKLLTDKKIDYVIANGAECEPLLDKDYHLMKNYSKNILEGLEAERKIVNATKGFVALKAKYKEAVENFKKEIVNFPNLELYLLDDFFPAGDEVITIYEVTGRIVPEAGLPLNVGVIVNNVETLYNVSKANNEPVTEKYLTVNGYVKNPITQKFPIGTSYRELLNAAGGATIDDFAIIDGGPMMGKVVFDLDNYIDKTTAGIIILPKDHFIIITKTQSYNKIFKSTLAACIQCQQCTDVCPRYLLGHRMTPHKIMRAISYINLDNIAEIFKYANLCCECGVCTFVGCPMYLSPQQVNQWLKGILREKGIKFEGVIPKSTHDMRNFRKVKSKKLVKNLNLMELDKVSSFIDKTAEISKVSISLKQGIGTVSKPLVKINELVKKGDLIATPEENKLGNNIHASISGKIIEINEKHIVIEKI